jgi:hypothetical protein
MKASVSIQLYIIIIIIIIDIVVVVIIIIIIHHELSLDRPVSASSTSLSVQRVFFHKPCEPPTTMKSRSSLKSYLKVL